MEDDKDLVYENSSLKKAKNELEGQIEVLKPPDYRSSKRSR